MKIDFFGQVLDCVKAIKGENSLTLFDEKGYQTVQYDGISDMSQIQFIDGEFESSEKKVFEERLYDVELILADMIGGAI